MLLKTVRFRLNQNEAKRFVFFVFSRVHKIAFSFQNELIPFIPKRWRKRQFTAPFFKTVHFSPVRIQHWDSFCSRFPSISVFGRFHDSVDDRPKRIKKFARFQANTKIWCYYAHPPSKKNQAKYANRCFVLKNDCSEAWQTATVRKVWATQPKD